MSEEQLEFEKGWSSTAAHLDEAKVIHALLLAEASDLFVKKKDEQALHLRRFADNILGPRIDRYRAKLQEYIDCKRSGTLTT